jgi:two-component system, NtrC family, response regulator AtoC
MLKILLALKTPNEPVMSLLKGHKADTLRRNESLTDAITRNNYELILFEGEMETLQSIKTIDPRSEVIFFGDNDVDAIEAVKIGASAYFSPPIEVERLKETVDTINDLFQVRKESAELEKLLSAKYTFLPGVIGKNPKMLDIFTLIRRIAPYFKTITIMGETGTGKEVIGKALHSLSPADRKPFIVCNCAGLVESLVESELFGHIKGAFTGAVTDKIGLFEAAEDGTIFLDEIGELPLSMQPRLLRVLQSGEFRRVGSNKVLRAQCRVIAATNKELAQEVKRGKFREDLYYRLTPLTIQIPPLRDRKDEIPLLCRFFLERFNERTGKKVFGISRPAQAALLAYDWHGNVRELENILEQASVMTTETFIRLEDLPVHLKETPAKEVTDIMLLDEVVKKHIETVLKQCKGNRSRASKILGISRRSLLRRIEKHSLI